MEKKYTGVVVPIITPVNEQEEVDEQGFRKLIRACLDSKLKIFSSGSNGECMALTQQQRERANAIAVSECAGRSPAMCGVMDCSTRRVIDNIKRLEQDGGTCAVITPVFYARHATQAETVRHFEEIAKHTAIDLIIYNIPMFVIEKIQTQTVYEIAQIDSVKGYKDSGGNFSDFMRCVDHFRGTDFCMLQGTADMVVPSMLMGADGYVPSMAPVFPELYYKLYEYGRDRRIDEALALNPVMFEAQKVLKMTKNATSATKFAIAYRYGFTDKRAIFPSEPIAPAEEQAIVAQIAKVDEMISAVLK